jgi:dihydropteroate synthase
MAVTAPDRIVFARHRQIVLGRRTLLMGVLNVTPDSFSDGGDFDEPRSALDRVRAMIDEGADIIDVGGESTRPGSAEVHVEDELARVMPVLDALRGEIDWPVSIDTYKAIVARAAVDAGADIINDIWGLQRDPDMARVASDTGAAVILMHNRTEADASIDIVADVLNFLKRSLDIAADAGIRPDSIVLDPGIGFGKTWQQSIEVIAHLPDLAALGLPILLGASRKSFIGRLLGIETPKDRLNGTLAAHLAGAATGARIIRAHDIKAHREALDVFDAIRNAE